MKYEDFLKNKIIVAENYGFEVNDGLFYVKAKLHELSVPTLFDLIEKVS